MNNNNLIQNNSKYSKDEKKALCRKGQKKSVEVRKHRKSFREDLKNMLEEDDMQHKILQALVNKALKGNVKAFEVIRNTILEDPRLLKDTETRNAPVIFINRPNMMSDEDFERVVAEVDEVVAWPNNTVKIINDLDNAERNEIL